MSSLPLITHPQPESIIAWRDGKPVTAARFLHDVVQLAALLPIGRHLLNACIDRYCFTVGLAAAMMSRKICLLPPTLAPQMIHQLRQFAPDAFCLTDEPDCGVDLPQVRYPAEQGSEVPTGEPSFAVPQIDGEQLVAIVFTSGSTGVPLPHRKNWSALVRNVQAEAALCGMDDGRHYAVIGTVPSQHMYGFESTVLMVLQSANSLVAARSFFPADICSAIESVPRPRVIVSTPLHLRAIVGASENIPPVDLVLSATAPLSTTLAHEIEARFNAPLQEIYGSTETGQIAMRKPTQTEEWTLFREVRLTREGDLIWAAGGHVEQPTPMNDVIEPVGEQHFRLHGRMADMINIAGKRNSLANLNLQLTGIPGVLDGAFFMPDAVAAEEVVRLSAFVVAPSLAPAAILSALRQRIDPAFLPRPLVMVDSLPRNATGKLPREALQALAAMHHAANGKPA